MWTWRWSSHCEASTWNTRCIKYVVAIGKPTTHTYQDPRWKENFLDQEKTMTRCLNKKENLSILDRREKLNRATQSLGRKLPPIWSKTKKKFNGKSKWNNMNSFKTPNLINLRSLIFPNYYIQMFTYRRRHPEVRILINCETFSRVIPFHAFIYSKRCISNWV